MSGMMTVAKLQASLSKYHPDFPVCVWMAGEHNDANYVDPALDNVIHLVESDGELVDCSSEVEGAFQALNLSWL